MKFTCNYTSREFRQQPPRVKANAPLPGGAVRRGHPSAQQQPRAGKAAASQLLEPLLFLTELQQRAGTP